MNRTSIILSLIALALTGCKKTATYTCDCETVVTKPDNSTYSYKDTYTYPNTTSSDAQSKCDAHNQENNVNTPAAKKTVTKCSIIS